MSGRSCKAAQCSFQAAAAAEETTKLINAQICDGARIYSDRQMEQFIACAEQYIHDVMEINDS